jgi:Putative zinc-binding metallo-peptidase
MTAQRVPGFEATKDATEWSLERERLLAHNITDLGLKIEGTYLEQLVQRLYGELDRAGIQFKPFVYLSDEWSCPDRVPVIGVPFYLADPKLSRIEDEMMDGIEASTEDEILGYLRHEAGHAINYAYKLYDTEEWRQIFGSFDLPYLDDYTPQPFSRRFVRHIPGWYAQKHPDEDFSETFAVWLTPNSNWQETYRDWGCYPKLQYVDRIVREIGPRAPLVTGADYDFTQEALTHSVAEHYRRTRPEVAELPVQFDAELSRIFGSAPRRAQLRDARDTLSADALIDEHRRKIVFHVSYWTGLNDVYVRSLVKQLSQRSRSLGLRVERDRSEAVLIDFTAFVTALCMNKLYKGDFVIQ